MPACLRVPYEYMCVSRCVGERIYLCTQVCVHERRLGCYIDINHCETKYNTVYIYIYGIQEYKYHKCLSINIAKKLM